MINLYSIFHINCSFSSIDEKEIPKLIKKSYWPLLNMIQKNNFNIGVECSGSSLEKIYKYDKLWVDKFRELIKKKKCELIGSGFHQIISPSCPEKITKINLKIGFEIYSKLLNTKPKLALINEQVFSKSLISIYNKFFSGIIIDWINSNQAINSSSNYFKSCPTTIIDDYKNKIPVIWSNSLAFQKFQRYVFGEISLENYLQFVNSQTGFLCIYSNDCEIFNFKDKRYKNNYQKKENLHWRKIENLFKYFKKNFKKYKLLQLSSVADKKNNKIIKLSSAQMPIIVKKQKKYNINRWTVCGENNFDKNSSCWKIYNQLQKKKIKKLAIWKELCDLWSSDYRTHTTNKKNKKFHQKINKLFNKLNLSQKNYTINQLSGFKRIKLQNNKNINIDNNFICFSSKQFTLKLNLLKGLTIDQYIDRTISNNSLFGTLYQGQLKYLDNYSDYYSGHFNFFSFKNLNKITDISFQNPKINLFKKKSQTYKVISKLKFNELGIVEKSIEVNLNKREVFLRLNFKNVAPAILRLFNITLNPKNFDREKLYFSSNNGGKKLEKFELLENFNHGSPVLEVSKYTSSNNSCAMTDGRFIIGDNKKKLIFNNNLEINPFVAMIEYKKLPKNFFLRTSFSCREMDDTYKFSRIKNLSAQIQIHAEKQ